MREHVLHVSIARCQPAVLWETPFLDASTDQPGIVFDGQHCLQHHFLITSISSNSGKREFGSQQPRRVSLHQSRLLYSRPSWLEDSQPSLEHKKSVLGLQKALESDAVRKSCATKWQTFTRGISDLLETVRFDQLIEPLPEAACPMPSTVPAPIAPRQAAMLPLLGGADMILQICYFTDRFFLCSGCNERLSRTNRWPKTRAV